MDHKKLSALLQTLCRSSEGHNGLTKAQCLFGESSGPKYEVPPHMGSSSILNYQYQYQAHIDYGL